MKKLVYTALTIALIGIVACGGDAQEKERLKRKAEMTKKIEEESKVPASERITVDNKGVGSIKNVELAELIDEEMEQDRCAKDLLVEFNGAAMANQNLTEDQARDILEYFRTLN